MAFLFPHNLILQTLYFRLIQFILSILLKQLKQIYGKLMYYR